MGEYTYSREEGDQIITEFAKKIIYKEDEKVIVDSLAELNRYRHSCDDFAALKKAKLTFILEAAEKLELPIDKATELFEVYSNNSLAWMSRQRSPNENGFPYYIDFLKPQTEEEADHIMKFFTIVNQIETHTQF